MPKSPVSSKRRSPLRSAADAAGTVMKALLLLFIGGYRVALRPLLGPACRFAPSCSVYAEEAVRRHGAITGGWMAVRRIGRCHPWNPGGYDPVQERSR